MKSYRTIAQHAVAEHEIKKSRFIGEIFPVRSDDEAIACIHQVKEAHKTARHHVYAYLLHDQNRIRYTDDGEPALTAGIPTLNVLQQQGLYDVLAVTTRYFGGTLLGTGGLVRAYTKAVQDALAQATIVEITWARRIDITVDYPLYERVMRVIQGQQAQVKASDFGAHVHVTVVLADHLCTTFVDSLVQITNAQVKIVVSDPSYMELEVPIHATQDGSSL